MKALTAAIVSLCLAGAACAQAPPPPQAEQWRAIPMASAPAQLGAEQIGRLRFLGGIEIGSEDPASGGLSDIAVSPDGAFLALNDDGHWFRGQLILDANGAPTGIRDVAVALMRDENGHPFETKEEGDSEGMAVMPDGRVAVSFEQSQVIRIYDLAHNGPFGAAQPGPPLAETQRLPANAGLEALASFADGRLLVGGEEGAPVWIATPGATTPVAPLARIDAPFGYGVTDFDRLPNGDFVALERFYAPVIGTRIRILLIPQAALTQGAVIQPVELALLQRPLAIDNFEGISAVAHDGHVVLYIVSDDNFSTRQRTLIYAFELAP